MLNYFIKKYYKSTFIFLIIGIVFLFLFLFLIVPLIFIFYKAFEKGILFFWISLTEPLALKAIGLTLQVILLVVPINTVFGLFTAWLISNFQFKGKYIFKALLDIPFLVSPIIAGVMLVFLFAEEGGIFSLFLQKLNFEVLFAFPGIVIATLFVTVPFVARTLIPFMESQGNQEEQVALTLGASGIQTFIFVTLPRIKWALLSGILLTSARSIGEFGAVSVVSGNILGVTATLTLYIEYLYDDYKFTSAFVLASIISFIGIINLIIKNILENRQKVQENDDRID